MNTTDDQEGPTGGADPAEPSGDGAVPLPPQAVPSAAGFRFEGVTVVGGAGSGSDRPERVVVAFDDRGAAVARPDRADQQLVRWSDVTSISIGEAGSQPAGRAVTPVELASAGGVMQFLIDTDPSRTVQISALRAWLARRPEQTVQSRSAPVPPVPPILPGPPEAPGPIGAHPPSFGAGGASRDVPGPMPYGPMPYGPMPYGPMPDGDRPYWVGPSAYRPPGDPADPMGQAPPRRTRRRRLATLLMAIALLIAAVGLASGLSATGTKQSAVAPSAPRLSSDQRLADSLMLTSRDLPRGWSVSTNNSGAGNSRHDRTVEQQITTTFARCMGVTDDQGAVLLGGQAADQTAQSSSPIFVGPSSATQSGYALELQTAADIVRTHTDELKDFSLFSLPRYPQCTAAAVASELQLGVNDATGGNELPGRSTAWVVHLTSVAGEQTVGLLMSITLSDRSTPLAVEVEAASLGSDRVEAQLQAFAIGGQIPSDVLTASVSAFEQRVASQGKSVVV